jgi:hypothetical protein
MFMPLSNIKTQCSATARSSGVRCLNPCIGVCKTCRYHGGRKNILVGTQHPNYKHGLDTKLAIAERKKKFSELKQLALSLGIKTSRGSKIDLP